MADDDENIADSPALREACELKAEEESYQAKEEAQPIGSKSRSRYLRLRLDRLVAKDDKARQALPELRPAYEEVWRMHDAANSVYDPKAPDKSFAIKDKADEKLRKYMDDVDRKLNKLCPGPMS